MALAFAADDGGPPVAPVEDGGLVTLMVAGNQNQSQRTMSSHKTSMFKGTSALRDQLPNAERGG